MKSIDTLINDIYDLVQSRGWVTDEIQKDFETEVGRRLQEKFNESPRRGSLRLSAMGDRCLRTVWYSVHHPDLATPLRGPAEIKYTFGHLIEAQTIALAKAAGHTVTGEQDVLELDGIVGHRDCVIDGVTVDVKSSASKSFDKFKGRNFQESDTFGYLDQLDGYVLAAAADPLVHVKNRGCLLAIDKQLGHMCLYEHEVTPDREETLRQRIKMYKTVAESHQPPPCTCGTRPDGASGNISLDVKASYSPYKYCCFPNLRTFLYANGPVYLTKVERRPYDPIRRRYIPEVDKNGNYVYN